MKNKVRIHNNSQKNSKASQAQSKSKIPKEPKINDADGFSGNEPVKLAIFDQRKKKMLADTDITAEQLQALFGKSKLQGGTVSGSLKASLKYAIMEGAIQPALAQTVRNASEDMELAVVQANVLLELIESHLDYREHRLSENFVGKRADEFNLGLSLLITATREHLNQARSLLIKSAFIKPESAERE